MMMILLQKGNNARATSAMSTAASPTQAPLALTFGRARSARNGGTTDPFNLVCQDENEDGHDDPLRNSSSMSSPSNLLQLGMIKAEGDDESLQSEEMMPKKRAPRALTGRHVRPGTGASPKTLEILRKKVMDRIRLKELLGENSHLYYGALNKQRSSGPKKADHNKRSSASLAAALANLRKH